MNKTKATSSEKEHHSKNVVVEGQKPDLLTWFPPILQDLHERSEYCRVMLNIVIYLLNLLINRLELEVGKGNCPFCSTRTKKHPLTHYRIYNKRVLTTGSIWITVRVKYYYCEKCGHRKEEKHDLTIPYGKYDRGIVLNGVAIYICGSSLADTRALLTQTFGVTPSTSTIQKWKTIVGKKAYHLNQEALSTYRGGEVQIDELFVALRDGKTEKRHTPAFATTIIESKYGTLLHVSTSYGSQTNRMIVEENLKQISHHEPTKIVGDGCVSYHGAIRQILPESKFVRDLQHEVRNVRKDKNVKKLLKLMKRSFKEELTSSWEQNIKLDRELYKKQLLDNYSDQPRTKEIKKSAKRDYDAYRRFESLQIEAHQQDTEEKVKFFEHALHRRLYIAKEAARKACQRQDLEGPFSEVATTSRLEGINRPLRSREKRSLCYRSILGFNAVICLYTLYHNMVGAGQGCLYELLGLSTPTPRWNPFYRFPPRIKSTSSLNASLGTPFHQISICFRQQHSHQISQSSYINTIVLPSNSPLSSMEVPILS